MELRDILKTEDLVPTIMYNESVGRTLSRAEIEDAIARAGYPPPEHDVLFYIVDNTDKMFLVRYFKNQDAYGFVKLTVR